MPSLADHHSSSLVKLLLLGDAKSGKTTALASLVSAGYHLRILDMDNLLDTLAKRVANLCPANLANVSYVSFRDTYAPGPSGMAVVGKPRAWMDSLRLLNNWKHTDTDGVITDLGVPATWGPNTILVIDSLTRWSDAAVDYHEHIGGKDGRMNYYNAQNDIEKQLAGLTSIGFATNLIVIAHGVLQDRPDGTKKMFPKSAGSALNPLIPTYFPNFIHLTKSGEKRVLRLTSTPMIDLATTDAAALPATLDVDNGLAEFFAVLRGGAAKSGVGVPPPPPPATTLARPTSLTLKRV